MVFRRFGSVFISMQRCAECIHFQYPYSNHSIFTQFHLICEAFLPILSRSAARRKNVNNLELSYTCIYR
jgi:hypothetical protein